MHTFVHLPAYGLLLFPLGAAAALGYLIGGWTVVFARGGLRTLHRDLQDERAARDKALEASRECNETNLNIIRQRNAVIDGLRGELADLQSKLSAADLGPADRVDDIPSAIPDAWQPGVCGQCEGLQDELASLRAEMGEVQRMATADRQARGRAEAERNKAICEAEKLALRLGELRAYLMRANAVAEGRTWAGAEPGA